MTGEQRPVKPTDLVVLTVRVIVAALCAPHFIAHYYHGHPDRKHGDSQEVLDLAVPQFLHCRIIGGALCAAIPASIIIGSIAVVFAVFLIVLVIVGDQVVESEAVMARYEIDTLLGFALL